MGNQAKPLVAVFGPSGMSGRYMLGALRKAGVRSRAVAHSDEGAAAIADQADEVVRADLANPPTLLAALEGVDAVYMIPPAMAFSETEFAQSALDAAEKAGARRFVYVSVVHPHLPPLYHHMRKAEAEVSVRHSKLEWTILQPGTYGQVACALFGGGPAGEAKVPFNVDSPFCPLDLRELGEVGVKLLTESGHDSATYEVCGPRTTMGEMIRIIAKVRGVKLEPVAVKPADFPLPPKVLARGDRALSDMTAMWNYYNVHGLDGNSTIMRMLLGREPASFEQIARSVLA